MSYVTWLRRTRRLPMTFPALPKVVSLTADNIATGAPVLGNPALTMVVSLTANNIATGAPVLGNPELSVPGLILDDIANADMGLSFNHVRAAYAGSCLRVRRSSDNAEQDIGFDGAGFLDTADMESFCGAGDGFVVTWYDQSLNGVNFTQATASLQPQIVSAGTFFGYIEQGNTTGMRLESVSNPAAYGTGDFTLVCGGSGWDGSTFSDFILLSTSAAVPNARLLRVNTNDCSLDTRNDVPSAASVTASGFFDNDTDFRHIVATRTGTSGEIFRDGTSHTSGTTKSEDVSQSNNWLICHRVGSATRTRMTYAYAFSRVLTTDEISQIATDEYIAP